ncbi:MAG: DUF1080 domain-containing protein [Proteiniphilum sp.]|jgi:hypothetical protein|uniref:3-keto-disaccharide hydrolase n=1 Tax=Proteiniphilum sp. TaxID=1926877 RepID=UPI002B20F66B|nr:DUF1080 domain-containing protein [Proteiniphilum sp.]MEA5129381.1 DUF1080 domain-containing protein [Proteiniphilum sp.]
MQTTKLPIVILFALLLTGCGQQPEKIFNGKDLSNWNFVVENNAVPGDQVYTVTEEGVISIKGEPLGYMYTKEKYGNFTLELEYRWEGEATNSGVFILIEDPANPFPRGIECQLAAGKAGDFVLLNGSDLNEYTLPEGITERPKFPVIGKMQPSSEKPTGEWNKMKITAIDGAISVYVNDILQNQATSKVKEGHIGLQSEGKEVHFRNLVIR